MVDTRPVNNNPLIWYRELVRFSLDTGTAPGIAERREELSRSSLTIAQIKELEDLDDEAIEIVLDSPFIDADLMADDNKKPLAKWWWHLGKIRSHTYPAELLPEHLRAVYDEQATGRLAA